MSFREENYKEYRSVHWWVVKIKGKPTTCEKCGKTDLKGRHAHWANIDHNYRRVLDDYIRMCVSCHRLWDYEHNFGPVIFTEEHKQRIRLALTGRKTGKPSWNRGGKMSKETREKMSLAKLGKPSPKKGKKYNKLTRKYE